MIEFILHGYGSSPGMLRRWWPSNEIGTSAIFLEGPEFDKFTCQRRWFAFSARPEALVHGLDSAVVSAERQINSILKSLELRTDTSIRLVGHSQGAMVSFEILRRQNFKIVEAKCFCGFLPQSKFTKTSYANGSTTVLNIYSSSIDQYIEAIDVSRTIIYFDQVVGLDVRHYQTTNLSHAFSPDWLDPKNFEFRGRNG